MLRQGKKRRGRGSIPLENPIRHARGERERRVVPLSPPSSSSVVTPISLWMADRGENMNWHGHTKWKEGKMVSQEWMDRNSLLEGKEAKWLHSSSSSLRYFTYLNQWLNSSALSCVRCPLNKIHILKSSKVSFDRHMRPHWVFSFPHLLPSSSYMIEKHKPACGLYAVNTCMKKRRGSR